MAGCSEVYSRRSTTGMAVQPEYSRGGLTEEYCRGVGYTWKSLPDVGNRSEFNEDLT
jgi:hypothetical protein